MVKRKRSEEKEAEPASLLKPDLSASQVNLETPFPRGGGSEVAPLDIRKASMKAARDVYDESKDTKRRKSKTKVLKPEVAAKDKKPKVETFALAKLKIGTLVLGQISEVHASHLTVSLPNNVIGFLHGVDYAIYKPGEWLRCVVAGLGAAPSRKLQLVADPALVNQTIATDDWIAGMSVQGLVQSVEDRGYILDLGGKRGFLAKNLAGDNVVANKIVLSTILKERSGVFTLTQQESLPLNTVHEQASLVPGVLVTAHVSSVLKGGHMCSVFGHIDISIDTLHEGDDMLDGAPEDARVLFSHPLESVTDTNRVLALSMLKHTIDLSVPGDSKAFTPGHILDVTKVAAITESALYLDIGVERSAYVHISNVADERIEDINTYPKYKVGTVHKARVLSYSYVDDCYYLTMKPSILEQKFLKVDEIEVGEKCEGVVDRILPKGGVIVTLGEGIKAICPEFYLSDIALQNPEKKFKAGTKVQARVLSTDPESNKVKIAIKKSIVHNDAHIVTDYPEIGTRTVGTIVALKERGAIIEFFNDIKGFLPLKEMSESKLTDPKTHFKLGQTVNMTVIDSNAETSRLVVSCRASRTVSSEPLPKVLEHVQARVIEKSADSYSVEINGHHAVLPFNLVSDEPTGKAKKSIQVGSEIEVIVLEATRSTILVSTKPLLLATAPPASFESLTMGDELVGYVRNVDDNGIFVAFAGGLVALMPKVVVGDKVYKQGQSVTVYVSSLDAKKERFLVSPELRSAQRSDGLKVGDEVTAVVTTVKPMQLNVQVGEAQGRIEMTQLFSSMDEIEDPKAPLKQFSKGDKIKCQIVGFHDARNHKFLPISHRSGTHIVFELSAIGGMKKEFKVGEKVLAFVNNFKDASCYVNLTPVTRSRIGLVDLGPVESDAEKEYPVGSVIEATVFNTAPVQVSAASEDVAVIVKVSPLSLSVKLPRNQFGLVSAPDALEEFQPLADVFTVGSVINTKVVEQDESNDKTWYGIVDKARTFSTGDVVKGYVKNVADGGLFVLLDRNTTGRVQIGQLSDEYLKYWKKEFRVGQVVEAKILSKSQNRIELTLKRSAISGKSQGQSGLEDLEVGAVMSGQVRNVQEFGIFVDIEGTQVSGLCHKSQVSDKQIKDMSKIFAKGDSVKIKVLDVDLEKRKVSLGMKASYFEDESDSDQDMAEEQSDEEEEQQELDGESDDEAMDEQDIIPIDDSDSESGSEAGSGSDSDSDSDSEAEAAPAAGVSAGFDWDADIFAKANESESDSDSDDDAPRKRRRGEKFVQDKTATINSTVPQSAQDFERLLVASPDSSVVWMNYMAFQLQLSEIDVAREIARRALKTIPQREEQERLNIWIAMLNLENSFGTSDTTQDVFKEACGFMDKLTIHEKMANIYAASDKVEEAKLTWNAACKKFGSANLDVWVNFGKFLYSNGLGDEAHKLLERAIKVLPERHHKDLTVQFAKLEYSLGDFERGRTLMEGLVSAYPKKIDLWTVYVDQEMKLNNDNRVTVTKLFERILNRKISVKQAKTIFKKWLSYEVECGDEKGVDYVKAKAQQFADSA